MSGDVLLESLHAAAQALTAVGPWMYTEKKMETTIGFKARIIVGMPRGLRVFDSCVENVRHNGGFQIGAAWHAWPSNLP